MQKLTRLLLFCCFALSWAGADAQDHALTRPMPDSWKYSEGAEQTLPSHDSWWRRFNDPVLDSLISMGEDANFDLITAYHRMEAASRRMTAARADYYPNIGLSAGYTRERLDGANSNRWSLGATAGWQIDVFGKVTAAVKQSKAGYQASRAEWIGAMVSMAGDIAATYMQLRVWQAELAVAQRHAVVQDSITALVEARFDCGLAAKPQLAQARAQAH
ncbi:MAG: TolC family protein, partial [Muribaculaceae bacterium]|nr:TolC family protein [Muribaculaceae bacterium]